VCEHENLHVKDRVKITSRENFDWKELFFGAAPKTKPYMRIFILKCKDKQDFLHIKLTLSKFVIDPEGFAAKPRWLENV
jgi:hypothetical protein